MGLTTFIASDHAGFALKQALIERFPELKDLGVYEEAPADYPDNAQLVANEIKKQPNAFGILICGSGIGISIAANRFPFIRAALCRTDEDARMSRLHNNANVLVLGGRVTPPLEAIAIVEMFFATAFEGGRHQKRLDKIDTLKIND